MESTFMERCAHIDGASLGDGAFSSGPAIWVDKREIAHFDGDGVLDVRLTKDVIRRRRTDFKADERITLRKGSSDWLEVRVKTEADADHAFTLVEQAVAANRSNA